VKSPSPAIVTARPHSQDPDTESAASPKGLQTPSEPAALKPNTEELLEHKRQLEQLNGWFEVALDNMARGLSMFDAEQRLSVCNKIYRDIYGLPTELTRPGTPLSDIVRYHVRRETGGERVEDIEKQRKWIDHHVAELARGKTFSYVQDLKDGRTILVNNQPLAAGGWVDLQEDITEKRRAEQRISWLARHDTLTEIANRFHFREQLEQALRTARPGDGFALHWVDLDKFKEVNDTYGHPVGDALLQSVARRLRAVVRGSDLVGRLGGDEFAILQRNARKKEEAERLAGRLLCAIEEPHEVAGRTLEIDASIGIVYAPENGSTVDDLLKNVDVALYKAKFAGGGQFSFFTQEEDEKVRSRHQLENDLKYALDRGQLVLHYQPIINLKTHQVTSFEALMRWNHPERGLIPPGDFIPSAEQTGLIVRMGEWALERACADAATWRADIWCGRFCAQSSSRSSRLAGSSSRSRKTWCCATHHVPTRSCTSYTRSACKSLSTTSGQIRVAELPAELPVRQDQDRPHVRARRARAQPQLCHRSRGYRAGQGFEDRDGGRGRRDARGPRYGRRCRLRRGSRLLLQRARSLQRGRQCPRRMQVEMHCSSPASHPPPAAGAA
jgi:diguanylate cyclase (GGDEF)-like protein